MKLYGSISEFRARNESPVTPLSGSPNPASFVQSLPKASREKLADPERSIKDSVEYREFLGKGQFGAVHAVGLKGYLSSPDKTTMVMKRSVIGEEKDPKTQRRLQKAMWENEVGGKVNRIPKTVTVDGVAIEFIPTYGQILKIGQTQDGKGILESYIFQGLAKGTSLEELQRNPFKQDFLNLYSLQIARTFVQLFLVAMDNGLMPCDLQPAHLFIQSHPNPEGLLDRFSGMSIIDMEQWKISATDLPSKLIQKDFPRADAESFFVGLLNCLKLGLGSNKVILAEFLRVRVNFYQEADKRILFDDFKNFIETKVAPLVQPQEKDPVKDFSSLGIAQALSGSQTMSSMKALELYLDALENIQKTVDRGDREVILSAFKEMNRSLEKLMGNARLEKMYINSVMKKVPFSEVLPHLGSLTFDGKKKYNADQLFVASMFYFQAQFAEGMKEKCLTSLDSPLREELSLAFAKLAQNMRQKAEFVESVNPALDAFMPVSRL